MNRYYLWDNNLGGILLAESVMWGYEKNYLVQVETNGLEDGMKELVEKAQQYGKKQTLEVHCHGHPAALHLGSPYGVTNNNVHSFGASVKNVIQPGGLIEILACWVASQGETDAYRQMLRTPITQIAGYREDYHGVLRREAGVKNDDSSPAGAARGLVFQQQNQSSRGLVYTPKPNTPFIPNPEDDGLKFCLTLAHTSGCRVRAGITRQMEDTWDVGPLNNPVGDWDNEVFDFYPSGQINFVGKSPYRGPKMNVFEMDRLQA